VSVHDSVLNTKFTDASSHRRIRTVCGSCGTRHGRVVHIINRNIIAHYLHNISGEGDGWTTGQWDWHIHGYQLNNLRFTDDIDLINKQRDMLMASINTLNTAGEAAAGLRINISKTKTLVFRSETTEEKMRV